MEPVETGYCSGGELVNKEKKKSEKRKPWFSKETMNLIDKRRAMKHGASFGAVQWKEMNKEIKNMNNIVKKLKMII